MSRMRIPAPALLFMGLCAGWIASCSDDDQTRACVPATTQRCAGVGRCTGVETCLEDGSGYSACDCSGPPRPDGAGGSAAEDPLIPHVGRKCGTDAECGEGLACLTSASDNFFGGGPANGYCTSPCQENAECDAIDSQSECFAGLCLLTCLSQNPTSLAENKCLGRRDLACQSLAYRNLAEFTGSRQEGLCFPQCGSDEDCSGRRCDLARGVCTDQAAEGQPIGSPCAQDTDCAGNRCFVLNNGESACTAPCVLGHPAGCGFGATASPREAGCATPAIGGVTGSEGAGDVGLCLELCDVDADCRQAVTRGWECLPRPEAEPLGRVGICSTPPPPDAGPADAQTDALGPDATTAPSDASVGPDGG